MRSPFLLSVLVHGAVAAAVFGLGAAPLSPKNTPITVEIVARPRQAAAPAPQPAIAPSPQPTPRPLSRRLPHPRPVNRHLSTPLPVAPSEQGALPVPPSSPEPPAPAPVPAPSGSPGGPPQAGQIGGTGTDLNGYLGTVNRAVTAHKHYPAMALEMEQEGEVQVLVRLNKDGSLAAPPALVRSCGHRILDDEALRMVARAAPFPPFPAGYPRPSAELRIPVRFDLPN